MEQIGFLVDLSKCIGCKACEIACKNRQHLVAPGPRPRRVRTTEEGTFPDTKVINLSLSCMHCADPACVANCPAGALSKDENDGSVKVDVNRCIGCKTCQVACKDRRDIQVAGSRLRRVDTFECGTYPEVAMFHLNLSCNHCESPACVANCPTGAMYKDDDGTVQHDDEACIGCQTCVNSCPYGAPQFIEEDKIVQKCDTCRALREAGHEPVCVEACPMRAIEFGDADELRAKHGDAVSELPVLPSAATTQPNLLLHASSEARRSDFNEVVL